MATAQTKDAQKYDVPLVSTNYANRFFKFLKSKGISEEAIIAHCPTANSMTGKEGTYFSINQLTPMLETAKWLLNDEYAAFEFGQQLDLDAHGVLGYSLLSTEDLPQLVETIVKHMQVRFPLFEMEVIHRGRDLIIQLNNTWNIEKTHSFIAKMYMGSIYTISKEICSRIHFNHSFPSSKTNAEWNTIAPNTQWNFNAPENQIILSQIKPIVFSQIDNNKKLNISYSLAESKHSSEKELSNNNPMGMTSIKVRDHIKESPNIASIERSATLLNMSSRYLRQQLADESTSFREISSKVKQEYANLYLCETPMPLNKIAKKLGFGDQASFTRAYRNWTGKTPGEVRKEPKKNTQEAV
jgi:AraC-like DNA-binding protein